MTKRCQALSLLFSLALPLLAQTANEGSQKGYANYMSDLTKRKHEVGAVFQFSSQAIPDVAQAMTFVLGATYQYNINPYIGWHSELSFGWEPILITKRIAGVSSNFINQMSMNLLTGTRVFPWKNWFFLGGGVGVRLFQNFMKQEVYNLLADKIPFPGSSSRFSLAPQYYFETGLVFPTKFLNIEIGYRWRGEMLGILQDFLKVKTDIVTQRGWGELVFALTVPLGKQSRTQEEILDNPAISLDGEFVKVDITDVFFPPNQSTLTSASLTNLNRLIPLIETLHPRQIIVRGHTFPTEIVIGGVAYPADDQKEDIALSRERAQVVRAYLEAQGVRGITIEAAAGDDPIQGQSPEKQRRVQIILVK